MPGKGQNRLSNRPIPTSKAKSLLFFQNPLWEQISTGPCRLATVDALYHARVYHAETGHQGEPFPRRPATHVHPVYHLIVVTGGKGHFRLGGTLLPVKRKILVATGPRDPHSFEKLVGETTTYAEVTFDWTNRENQPLSVPFPEMLSAWAGETGSCRSHQEIAESYTAELEKAIGRLVHIGRNTAREQAFLRLGTALGRVLELCYLATATPTVVRTPWEKARLYLLENYAQPAGIGKLAQSLGVHADYLTRKFRQAYGITPLAFQHHLQIEASKIWLVSTDYTLKEIADRAGFDDPGYFSRLFRQKEKMAPGKFRRLQRQIGA